jgi:hypothetical protein
MPTVSRRQLTIAIAWSVLVMIITCGPYIEARRMAGDRYFSGLVSAVDDGNVYLQWIRQAAEGQWTLGNQYTTEEQRGLWFNAFLLLLGRVAGLLHLSPVQVFHAARFVGGCLCLVSFFLLVCHLSPDGAVRWTALVLVSLASGLGWLLVMLDQHGLAFAEPVDYGRRWLYQPEAITFVSLTVNPLFAVSLALICLTLVCALRGLQSGRIGWPVAAGVLLLVLGNIHTYDILVVNLTLICWSLIGLAMRHWSWRRAALHYGIILLLSAAAPAWQWHVMAADPVYRAKAETPTLSGPFLNYALGQGLPWLLALAGTAWVLFGKSAERGRLAYVVAWAVIASLVIYAPVPSQRKLAEGMHFPVCILAAVAVAKVLGGWLARYARSDRGVALGLTVTVAIIATASLPSNLLFYQDCFEAVWTNNAGLLHVLMPPIYLRPGEIGAIDLLQRDGTDRDVVMCSSMIGNHIPALSRCRVVAGHWAETLHLQPIRGGFRRLSFERYALPAVLGFFSARSSLAEKAQILLRFRVTYVFCGPFEEALYAATRSGGPGPMSPARPSPAEELAALPYLQPVYEADGVVLFRVGPRAALLGALTDSGKRSGEGEE